MTEASTITVSVLGAGCKRCQALYAEAEQAIAEVGVEVELRKVESLDEIMSYAVLATPALVIDGEVRSAGTSPKAAEIAGWLRERAAR
jgi:small redox-active disulfide protein 2